MVSDKRQHTGRILGLSVASGLHVESTRHIAGKAVTVVHAAVTARYLAAVNEVLVVGLTEEIYFVDIVPLAAAHGTLVVVAVVSSSEEFAARVCPVLDEGVPGAPVVRFAAVADGCHVVPLGVVDGLVPCGKQGTGIADDVIVAGLVLQDNSTLFRTCAGEELHPLPRLPLTIIYH